MNEHGIAYECHVCPEPVYFEVRFMRSSSKPSNEKEGWHSFQKRGGGCVPDGKEDEPRNHLIITNYTSKVRIDSIAL